MRHGEPGIGGVTIELRDSKGALIASGKEFEKASWDAWVAEKKAQPLPGVVAFGLAEQKA